MLVDDIWNGKVGDKMHKHEFDGPWLEGESCNKCHPTLAIGEIVSIDKENGTVTVNFKKTKWAL